MDGERIEHSKSQLKNELLQYSQDYLKKLEYFKEMHY